MLLGDLLNMASRAIWRKPLRSILTSLGVVIGVASVSTMLTVGSSATLKVKQDISKLGSNLLTVVPGQFRFGGVRIEAKPFKPRDVEAIAAQVSGIKEIAPASRRGVKAVFGNKNWQTTCTGSTSSFLSVRNWELEIGRSFTETEEKGGAAVCIIGSTVKERLFGQGDPIGAVLRVDKAPYKVIGVLKEKGLTFGPDSDDFILVPLKAFQRRISGSSDIGMVYVSVQEGYSSEAVREDIRRLLRERRKLAPGEPDDFEIRDLKELAETLSSTTKTLTAFLGAIAAISLVVGGIGIMNIMLVSVTERTREIGLRLALGARQKEILLQFLIEAILLSLFGGLMGLVLSLGASYFLCKAMSLPFVLKPWVLALGFGFSVAVGVLFGFIPAHRASKLNPIEALRHE